MSTKIIIATDDPANTQRWCRNFSEALPDAQVMGWEQGKPSADADYAIVWKPPADAFESMKGVKAIFNLGAGVDSLVANPALPADVPVVRLEDAGMASQMAEYVVHAVIRIAREFDVYEQQQREGRWQTRPPIQRREWPIGVLGMGTIGLQVARALASLGFPVAGWARSPREIEGVDCYSGEGQWSDFLARTRVLVNVLPLTPQTDSILNRKTFSQLLPGAVIISVGRGEHLIEEDLLAALDDGSVQAAVLDVFRTEPLPADHPFWGHPRVSITPHVAAITVRQETIEQIAGKIGQLERGEDITGVVSRATGY